MKRSITKIFTAVACAAMIATAAPVGNMQSVQAATVKSQGTVNLTTKKLVIPKGTSTAIKNNTLQMIKGRKYQIKAMFGSTVVKSQAAWKSTKPAVVTVSKTGLIAAKAPGAATIQITYKGKTQSIKIKVIASHGHTWKSIAKATCKKKGKKICKTCGVTSTVAKTAHTWKTDVWESVEGRGKSYTIDTIQCNGCNTDMYSWTLEEIQKHQGDIDGILAGTSSIDCFSAGYHGVSGKTVYPKYMKVRNEETTCKYCGVFKNKTKVIDLYNCDNRGRQIPEGTDPFAYASYENYCKEHGIVNKTVSAQ